MNRFFIEKVVNMKAVISGQDAVHINRVLRLRQGDSITLCDKNGVNYIGTIEKLGKDEIIVSAGEGMPGTNEPNVLITVYQSITKGKKIESVIQKCVELGASSFVPVMAKRSVAVYKKEADKINKVKRWQSVSESAAKQSKRDIIPVVHPIAKLTDALGKDNSELKLIAYENETASLKSILAGKTYKSISVLIGPEGGFEESEVSYAKENGFVSISLGKRILRTETAAPALTAVLMYLND